MEARNRVLAIVLANALSVHCRIFASQLSDSAHHSVCDLQSLSKRGILIINRSAWRATYFYIYAQGR